MPRRAHRRSRRGDSLWAAAAALLTVTFGSAVAVAAPATADRRPATAHPSRTEMLYAIAAHPDKEFSSGWGLVQRRPETYVVFVILTQGEQTLSCMRPAESQPPSPPPEQSVPVVKGFTADGSWEGPYTYQGPRSPVGQPDQGERHPFGFPWRGKGSQACKDARVASWHWFLDDMAKLDPSLPDMRTPNDPTRGEAYRGRHCRGAGPRSRVCAKVWATPHGARVAFDLGDGNLTAGEVTMALRQLRRSRSAWGLPRLPESVLAAASYYDGDDPTCLAGRHPDAAAVQDAIYEVDHDAGPQYGPACRTDARLAESFGTVAPTDPLLIYGANAIDPATERRIGAYVRNYGWLSNEYTFQGDTNGTFWRRFG